MLINKKEMKMLLDEILVNLNESAEAEHPENCDCPECKAKRAEECEGEECMEECGEAQSFWKETGIDESEEKELANVNAKMRELMAKRSQSAPGSKKQEAINNKLDKIYDRRHELMSKRVLTEDGEGSKVLEALEDINSEIDESKDIKCDSVTYDLKTGHMTCDGKEIDDEMNEDASEDDWDKEAIESAKEMDTKGCEDCTTVDGRDDMTPFKESVYKVGKNDGSNEYVVVESVEKFANYISESFEDIVSFEKINTEALNESMDHEIVDTIVAEASKDKKASMGEIQSLINDMVDDSMSEEFIKTIYNKIINRLSELGIEVEE